MAAPKVTDLSGRAPKHRANSVLPEDYPKDPAVLKNTTRSKFATRSIFTSPVIYYRGAPCADTIFLGITDSLPLKEGSAPY